MTVADNNQHYNLEQVEPGMKLAEDIINQRGNVLIAEGTILDKSLLAHLLRLGVKDVQIETTTSEQAQTPKVTLEEIKMQHLSNAVQKIKESFRIIEKYKKIPIKILQDITDNELWPLVSKHLSINYTNLEHSKKDYLYDHSVNVALLSGLLGLWSGYNKNQISELILTGLLHDIGKTQIPPEILNKPENLTKDELKVMQLHATYSFSLIKEVAAIPQNVKFAVLQHHERLDGSGYPGHFKQEKIHPYARVVAIADIYDAMTSERNYSHKNNPFTAVQVLTKDMYSKLDATLCTTFLTAFCNCIIGNKVQLKDGREGEIIYTGHFLNFNLMIRMENNECLPISDWQSIKEVTAFPTKSQENENQA
jgi:HD-GYP domain-containing protein (c-di-GMP phosphodiesterase class II)